MRSDRNSWIWQVVRSRVTACVIYSFIALGGGIRLSAQEPAAPIVLDEALRQRCLTLLRDGLKSDAFWPAMHAAEALSDHGLGQEVRTLLRPRVADEKDDQRRCGLARELVRAGDRLALPELFAVLKKDDTHGHTHAAESLYKIAEIDDGRLMRNLYRTTPDARRRLMAAAALARSGDQEALAWIRSQVDAKEAESRKIAAWILARLGAASDVEALRKARDAETDHVTKAYQNHALAALGESSGVNGLARNLTDANDEVRTYASELVGHLRLASLQEALIKNLDDPFLDVRIRSAQSLLALSRPPTKSQLAPK